MELFEISDEALDQKIATLVANERLLLTQVLHHLREAERRRLFSKYGFKSLFEYATQRFGYSEDQAYRRISAMRLLRDLPQVEEKIASGALSLSNIAQAQTYFRQEAKQGHAKSEGQKLELLAKIENCSKREVEKHIELIERRGDPAGADVGATEFNFSEPTDTGDKVMSFRANANLQKKMARLIELKALPELAFSESVLTELIDFLCDLGIAKLDPLAKAERAQAKKKSAPVQKQRVEIKPPSDSRYVPAAVRHVVYLRDGGRCQKCGSNRRIEIDHIKPHAKGGDAGESNLRLLCRSCNERAAIEDFGQRKMSSFLRSPVFDYQTQRRLTESVASPGLTMWL